MNGFEYIGSEPKTYGELVERQNWTMIGSALGGLAVGAGANFAWHDFSIREAFLNGDEATLYCFLGGLVLGLARGAFVWNSLARAYKSKLITR